MVAATVAVAVAVVVVMLLVAGVRAVCVSVCGPMRFRFVCVFHLKLRHESEPSRCGRRVASLVWNERREGGLCRHQYDNDAPGSLGSIEMCMEGREGLDCTPKCIVFGVLDSGRCATTTTTANTHNSEL